VRRRQKHAGGKGEPVVERDSDNRERVEHQPNIFFRHGTASKVADNLAQIDRCNGRIDKNGANLVAPGPPSNSERDAGLMRGQLALGGALWDRVGALTSR
jgi:hypothetical protein